MTGIRLDSVTKVYDGRYLAVDDVSLEVPAGEFLVLLGPSGCGKTTLLRMIAGLEDITAGDIWFGRSNITMLPPKERGVALVFQNGALYPNRTTRENILFPLQMAKEEPAEANAKAVGVARILQIDSTLDRLPRTLSGGQRQRVAIGRAIVRQPRVFLMDEPLSNLDATMRTELRQELGAMVRDLDVTTVYVTHDQIEALTLADRVAVMRNGKIEDIGTPEEVFNDPATAFVAGFLGSPRINLMSATVKVTAHHRVTLELGTQSIALPPTDRRSLILNRHDGARVIVGARSDAFTLTSDADTQLTGSLRTLEFHGNQWIAFVECGLELVNPDLVGVQPPTAVRRMQNGHTRHAAEHESLLDKLRNALRRTPAEPPPEDPAPAHRRADLILEVPSNEGLKPRDTIRLAVDTAKLHLFGEDGRRIDRLTRQ